jgi:hypothetical protein
VDTYANKQRKEFKDKRIKVFHEAMREILRPFEDAAIIPTDVVCGDGVTRSVVMPLAMHCGDWPEQCVIAGLMQGTNAQRPCNQCEVPGVRLCILMSIDRCIDVYR